MQQIQLSQNKIVLLDDDDFERLSQHHWCYRGERNDAQGYAIRHAKVDGKVRTVYMHREIMGQVPPGHEVIFLNRDRLDCRRENLLIVNKEEARRHHRVRSDSQSMIKGLTYNPRPRTWSVNIYHNGSAKRVGTFFTQQEALDAYREAVLRENPDLYAAPEVIARGPQAVPVEEAQPGCRVLVHEACQA
jgi:hypothetical protein